MGPRTAEFEAAFAEYTGARHALAVTNGTAALHLICLAAGLGPGDEVIVPSLTFVASVNAIAYTGATPVFAEIAALDRAVARRRRGRGGDHAAHEGDHDRRLRRPPRRDRRAARRSPSARGLMLLEDAAHAIGVRLGGRHLGTFGAAGAFSFFSNKNLAVGEGGRSPPTTTSSPSGCGCCARTA